jgi:hypothetical protein
MRFFKEKDRREVFWIIPPDGPGNSLGRLMLATNGIGINSAENTMYISPEAHQLVNSAAANPFAYTLHVSERVSVADAAGNVRKGDVLARNTDAVIDELQQIAGELHAGDIWYPRE